METVAVIARLKPRHRGASRSAPRERPPFDPEGLGLRRHRAFLSAGEVVFLFEGHQVEWIVDDLVSDPYASRIDAALEAWRPLIEPPPRVGRPVYDWERG